MRLGLNEEKLKRFLEEVGNAADTLGTIFLSGGATALLLGIRAQTIDVNLKLDPEPGGIFEILALLKERLSMNIELASPDLFLPAVPGWRSRCKFIGRWGKVEVFHYDFYSQALAKILRGHLTDTLDVEAYVRLGLVQPKVLLASFEQIRSGLLRFPAINVEDFSSRVHSFVERQERGLG